MLVITWLQRFIARMQKGHDVQHLLHSHDVIDRLHRRLLKSLPCWADKIFRDRIRGMNHRGNQIAVGPESGHFTTENHYFFRRHHWRRQIRHTVDPVTVRALEINKGLSASFDISFWKDKPSARFRAEITSCEETQPQQNDQDLGDSFHNCRFLHLVAALAGSRHRGSSRQARQWYADSAKTESLLLPLYP